MDIEKLRKMTWREKRDLAETTNNMQLLILLAEDKSVYVRREILYREDAPFEAIEKIYKMASNFKEKDRIIRALYRIKPCDAFKNLLIDMVSDSEIGISRAALWLFRQKFGPRILKLDKNIDLTKVTDEAVLSELVIQLAGFGEESEISQTPNVTGEIAHKFVMALYSFQNIPYRIQKCLYHVLSHDGILEKTLQYIYETECSRNGFYDKPKYAISVCNAASSEMLHSLVEDFIADINFADWNVNAIAKDIDSFISGIATNPNCDKDTFERVFNLYISCDALDWPLTLRSFAESQHFTKDHLLNIIKNYHDGAYMFIYAPEKILELEQSEIVEIISGLSQDTKKWFLNCSQHMPESLFSLIKP